MLRAVTGRRITTILSTDPAFAAITFERRGGRGGGLPTYARLPNHGMLTTTFGAAWITSGKLKVRFRKPAYVDGTVTAWGTVKKADAESGVLQITVGCRDEHGDDLVTGSAELTLSQ